MDTYLFCVERVVQTKTPDGLHVFQCQRCQEQPDISNLVCNLMLSEDIPGHDARLLGLGDVGYALRQNRIAIVDLAISGEEADESLSS